MVAEETKQLKERKRWIAIVTGRQANSVAATRHRYFLNEWKRIIATSSIFFPLVLRSIPPQKVMKMK